MEQQTLKAILTQLQQLNDKADKIIAYAMMNKATAKSINTTQEQSYNDWFKSSQADKAFKDYLEKNDINKQSER